MNESNSNLYRKELKISFPNSTETKGLINPILLQDESTLLDLNDYFLNPLKIRSFTFDKCLIPEKIDEESKICLKYSNETIKPLIVSRIWFGDTAYSILMKKSPKINYTFEFKPDKEIKSVFITGDFNNWSACANPLYYSDGIWKTSLRLFPGRITYQLIVDGEWIVDSNNNDTISNNMGGYNSTLLIGEVENINAPKLLLDSIDGNNIIVSYDNKPECIFVFWENFQYVNRLITVDSTNNQFYFPIPENATDIERSFIRVYSYNDNGISNDLLIPLSKNKVIQDSDNLVRTDYEASVLYFLIVDRFKNGNDSLDFPIKDSELDKKSNFQGGDLYGILDKIKSGYFSDLGVNTIWISPITKNPDKAYNEFSKPYRKSAGYHGYWPVSSWQVDQRFGNEKIFEELVNEAHERGINIILDYVSNHVHEDHPIIKTNPSWKTNLFLSDGSYNIKKWDEERLTTWFDKFLPTLDYSKPEVVDTMTDYAIEWLKKYKLDGFRHDATKHIPKNYWRTLTQKIKKDVVFSENRRIFQIGETFGSRELIGSYVGAGLLDAQFDFNLYFSLRNVLINDNESFEKLDNSLKESFLFYGNHSLMGNITGNHDVSRFISYASGALRFDEDDKEAGWQRDIKVKNLIGYKKLKMLNAFIMTIPGVPVIYYGDEIGMPGANDPDNRRMMRFEKLSKEELDVKECVQKLVNFRRNNLALTYGDFQTLLINEKQYVYARKYFNDIVIVVFNKSEKSQKITIDIPQAFNKNFNSTLFNSNFSKINNKLNIELQAYSFEVLF